jgi:hypothetical protein
LNVSTFGSVEFIVNQVRMLLALCLPLLWLAASASCALDPINRCPSAPPASSVSARGHTKDEAANSVCSFDRSARRLSRRENDRSDLAAFLSPMATFPFQLPAEPHIGTFSIGSACCFGLAKCWQFRWRTAFEPRAPSSVS